MARCTQAPCSPGSCSQHLAPVLARPELVSLTPALGVLASCSDEHWQEKVGTLLQCWGARVVMNQTNFVEGGVGRTS